MFSESSQPESSFNEPELLSSLGKRPKKAKKKLRLFKGRSVVIFTFVILAMVIAIVGVAIEFFRPASVEQEQTLVIQDGYTLTQSAETLHEAGLIRYPEVFRIFDLVYGQTIKSGSYSFDAGLHDPRSVYLTLTQAEFGSARVRITIPEGVDRNTIADILAESELSIDREEFLAASENFEGMLFPETYFFFKGVSPQQIVNRLREEFNNEYTTLTESLDQTLVQPRDPQDIIIMASIIEREATNDLEEMQIVSGILWKRLDEGMLLQVDAPFVFYLGKGSHDLTLSDLRADHPYNTYVYQGLTPGPIGNPGTMALQAAHTPIETPYYFYLHDGQGRIHYGVTHDDHVANKRQYLQ